MAKCISCGKSGLFVRLDSSGYCAKCSRYFREIEGKKRLEEEKKRQLEEERKKEESRLRKIYESTLVNIDSLQIINMDLVRKSKEKFIAIDLETTGLSPVFDKIIQLSVTIFNDGKVYDSFSTYVNPGMHISDAASRVNHITDSMVLDAPSEKEAIKKIIQYLGNSAFQGHELFVSHNVGFDMQFLKNALKRSGINAHLICFDTLFASRKIIGQQIKSKKLSSVADFLGIKYTDLHDAAVDSALSGEIFIKLMELTKIKLNEKYSAMTQLEYDTCVWFKEMLDRKGCDTKLLCFNSTSYLTVYCYSAVLKFKPRAKKPYVIVSGRHPLPDGLNFSPCPKSEGDGFLRYHYNSVSELELIEDVLKDRYQRVYTSIIHDVESSNQMRTAADFIFEHITV